MSRGVQERLMRGLAAQGFAQVVNMGMQLFSVPMFLHFWGKTQYGEWLLLSTIPSYFALSDLSFGSAAGNEMTMLVAAGDRERALKVFQSAWLLITGVSLACLALAGLALPFAPIDQWLHLTRMSHMTVQVTCGLLIAQVVLSQQGGLLDAGWRCEGNYPMNTFTANLLRLVEFLACVVVLFLHGGPMQVAATVLLIRLPGYSLIWLCLKRTTPWLALGWRHAEIRLLRPLIGPALSFNAFPLGWAFSLQGMVTVVGIAFGPGAVVVFSTTRTLTRIIFQLLNAITNTVWAEFSAAFGAGNLNMARNLHRRACQVGLWGALFFAVCLIAVGPSFHHFWTRGRTPFDPGLFHLLLIDIILCSIWSTSYVVPVSINKHQGTALVFLAVNGSALGSAILLARLMGLNGVAVALIGSELAMITYVLHRSLSLLHDNLADYVSLVLRPPIGWIWKRVIRSRHGEATG